MEREIARRDPPLEDGERGATVGARKRPGLGNRRLGILGGIRQGDQKLGPDERHVGRKDDHPVRLGQAKRCGDADDRRADLASVVEHGERKRERIGGLTDHNHLVERPGQNAVGPLGERLALVEGKGLGRAEARARPADQKRAGYAFPAANHARASSRKGSSPTDSRRRYSTLRASRRSSSNETA